MQYNGEYENIDYNNQELQKLNSDFSKMNDEILQLTYLVWFIGGFIIGIYLLTFSYLIYTYYKNNKGKKIQDLQIPLVKAVEKLDTKIDDIQIIVEKLENKDK